MLSTFQNGDSSIGYGTGYGPSSHMGDLQGIINALDYIHDLGFNCLWMTPIFDSTGGTGGTLLQSTGYFATNYFKVDPHFGTEDTLRTLISKAHSLGIYVLLDGVLGHHGGVNVASPNGNWPQGGSNPVSYPDSLPYFKEVVQYWINEFAIDGWRLDQCYQLYQNGHNYLKEIREAVYEACDARRAAGEEWGILGYVVGEDWEGISDINTHTYGDSGLVSAFDFPFRYNMVQGAAQEESGAGGYGINTFSNVHQTPSEKGYPSDVFPNLFITNHDLWRFGNLVRSKYNYGVDNIAYWRRYKMCIGALAVYTGPITIYYGDEIGDITDCWWGSSGSTCGSNTASDNCARTDGKISGFNSNQQDLHDFTKALLTARSKHPSMWRGTNGKTFQGDTYFNCKYDSKTADKTVYVTTMNTYDSTVSYMVGGVKLIDLVTGETITGDSGTYQISLPALGTRVFQVVESNSKLEAIVDALSNSKSTIAISISVVAVVVVIVLFIKNRKPQQSNELPIEIDLLSEQNDQKEGYATSSA
jgi:glycosidase